MAKCRAKLFHSNVLNLKFDKQNISTLDLPAPR